MIRPFKDGMMAQACPMANILGELSSQLNELKSLRQEASEQSGFTMAPS